MNRIDKDVKDSLSQLYNNNQSSTCTLIFTEPKPAHEVVLQRVLHQVNEHVDHCHNPTTCSNDYNSDPQDS